LEITPSKFPENTPFNAIKGGIHFFSDDEQLFSGFLVARAGFMLKR